MTEAMDAEFDTVAEWTAEVAIDLGPDHHVPAGCRGSGSPAALDWLADRMDFGPGTTVLDCGAGVGGPAARAAEQRSVRPLLVEPEAGACRAARRLFDHPVVQAGGAALPVADESLDAAWCLGVLCTTPDKLGVLTELRRVVRPAGAIGLLVFVATDVLGTDVPEGNDFPTVGLLTDLAGSAGLHVETWQATADLPSAPRDWQEREDAVEARLEERYGRERAWQLAERQSSRIGDLLSDGRLSGELLVLRRA